MVNSDTNMQWIKTWLRKWLGVEERAYACDVQTLGEELKNLRQDAIRENRFSLAINEKYDSLTSFMQDQSVARIESFNDLRKDLMDVARAMERYEERIHELELLVKDATLDTTLAALEDRVAKLELTPAPTPTVGRRGGSAWSSHQVAASAGAARANGIEVPLPTPGVS